MEFSAREPIKFERGVFTISIDFELIWGTLDLFGPERFRKACEVERRVVIDRLLILDPILKFIMRLTKTGMQLEVWLRKVS